MAIASGPGPTWIVFERDHAVFEREFPKFRVEGPEMLPWLSWLASGGVNLRSIVPRPTARLWTGLDAALRPLDRLFAIHWHWRLRKAAAPPGPG